MIGRFKKLIRCESGATAIEYGLIAAIIGIGLIVSMTSFRDNFRAMAVFIQTSMAGR